MKRKFFSVMLAACAAVFSFSGLTGCSGGGDEDSETYGMVTLYEFYKGKKGFNMNGGMLRVMPVEKAPVQAGDEEDPEINRQSGTKAVYCIIYVGEEEYQGNVLYRFDWPANAEYPTKGTVDSETYLSKSGTCLELPPPPNEKCVSALTNALGNPPSDNQVRATVGIELDFASSSFTAHYALWKKNDKGQYVVDYPDTRTNGTLYAELNR